MLEQVLDLAEALPYSPPEGPAALGLRGAAADGRVK
jgi:hypothetical protein